MAGNLEQKIFKLSFRRPLFSKHMSLFQPACGDRLHFFTRILDIYQTACFVCPKCYCSVL